MLAGEKDAKLPGSFGWDEHKKLWDALQQDVEAITNPPTTKQQGDRVDDEMTQLLTKTDIL
jgi:hypothetical protein